MGLEKLRYKYPKLENYWVGFFFGALGPWIGFVLYYVILYNFMQFGSRTFEQFATTFFTHPHISSSVLAICINFNILLLALSSTAKFNKMFRGILHCSLVYGLVIVYLYFK